MRGGACDFEFGIGGGTRGIGLPRIELDECAVGERGCELRFGCGIGVIRFGALVFNRKRRVRTQRLLQFLPFIGLAGEVDCHGSVVVRRRGARRFHRRRGSLGCGRRRLLDFYRVTPFAFKRADNRQLLSRRSKGLRALRLVPFRDCSAGLLIIDTINRAGVKAEPFQPLLQLTHVFAADTGRQIAVGRH